MKKLFFALLTVLALAGTNSCTGGSGYNDPFGNNPGDGHHRGDSGTGDDGGGGQGSKSVFPGDQTYNLMADAVYYGNRDYPDADLFTLFLYWGEYDENNDFKTVGTELAFDILCPKTGRMELSPGRYSCVSDDYTPYHFLDGIVDNDQVFPSYAYYKSAKGSKVVVISDGTMDISTNNGKCNITVVFKAQAPDSQSEATFKVNFNGDVAYFDGRDSGGDVPNEVEMKSFSRVVAEYWGQLWEDDSHNTIPIDDWVLYLYGENSDEDNEYATVELFTEPGTKTLAPGIYNDFAQIGNLAAFKPGAVLAGYTEGDDNIAYGTWYCKNGTAYYAASKGQIAIASKDDLYSITFDFIDEDDTLGGRFKGSYTGKIEVIDMAVQTKSGAHRGSAVKSIAKMSPRRNTRAARHIPDSNSRPSLPYCRHADL